MENISPNLGLPSELGSFTPHIDPTIAIAPSITEDEVLSRKRRMNFLDLADVLDRDGHLHNDMLMFTFAATMLSTLPVILGTGLADVHERRRRRKRSNHMDQYSTYTSYDDSKQNNNYPSMYSDNSYEGIMTQRLPTKDYTTEQQYNLGLQSYDQNNIDETSIIDLLKNLVKWSHSKVEKHDLVTLLVQLAVERFQGKVNPADKLVANLYRKWNEL